MDYSVDFTVERAPFDYFEKGPFLEIIAELLPDKVLPFSGRPEMVDYDDIFYTGVI